MPQTPRTGALPELPRPQLKMGVNCTRFDSRGRPGQWVHGRDPPPDPRCDSRPKRCQDSRSTSSCTAFDSRIPTRPGLDLQGSGYMPVTLPQTHGAIFGGNGAKAAELQALVRGSIPVQPGSWAYRPCCAVVPLSRPGEGTTQTLATGRFGWTYSLWAGHRV